jgi:alkylation response protein AidB-like acyl-CoA dehydrogenase
LMEEIGRAMLVEPFLPVAVIAPRLLIASDLERAVELLPPVVEGSQLIVPALSEPAARGAIGFVQTRARREGGNWVIDGHKSMVTGAPFADWFIVSARTAGADDDAEGISLFLVGPKAAGVDITDIQLSDGSRAGDIRFAGLVLPGNALLGAAGSGFAALRDANAHALLAACAEAVGAMDAALWITRNYLQTRKQFGVAIGSFQALQHRMADMLIEVELSRSMLHRALAFFGAGADERDRALSLTKMQIGKAAKFVGGQAIQLHGGIGVTAEYLIGHYFKRLMMIENLFGNSALHAGRVAARDRDLLG